MTANDILEILDERYCYNEPLHQEWACFHELRFGTGYRGFKCDSRIDYYAMNMWDSKKKVKIAYEIKVSKKDLLDDLARPYKQFAALSVSNEFYYIWPKEMLTKEELYNMIYRKIPEWAGIILVEKDKPWKKDWIVKEAPFRDVDSIPWSFACAIARRAAKAECQIKETEKLNANR